jgi:hypothetical protein
MKQQTRLTPNRASQKRSRAVLLVLLATACRASSATNRTPCTATDARCAQQRNNSVDPATSETNNKAADNAQIPETGTCKRSALQPQDIAILFPLPATANELDLLLPALGGSQGSLFLPSELSDFPLRDPQLAVLRLVAVRFDLCPRPTQCRPEVRATFQELYGPNGTEVWAEDSAVHVSYATEQDEMMTLLRELLDARDRSCGYASEPLGIHPILAREGLTGPFAQTLRSKLTALLKAERVTQIAVMSSVRFEAPEWVFRIYSERTDGFVRAQIAEIGREEELVTGSGVTDIRPTASITNSTPLDWLLGTKQSSKQEQNEAWQLTNQLHDLATATFDTVRCSSCHLAESALRVGRERYGLVPSTSNTVTPETDYRRDLPTVTNVHAFSYVGRAVSVNLRTAKETAESVQATQQLLE